MYLKIRKFPCVRAHRGNLINYMRTDTKDLLTNRFGGNEIKQYVCAVIVFLEFPRNYVRYLQTTLLSNSHIVSTERN
jgi:hypothetical protein